MLRSAQKQLTRLPAEHQERILVAMEALADEPRPQGCSKLTGRDAWRIRVGDYRIIYEIFDDRRVVIVVVVGHRKDAYR
ncbi:MAG: type II toxin-antitoxin system RelE family toxin [Planctomycetia bacterium]